MWFRRKESKAVDEWALKERQKLADEISRNSRARESLLKKAKDNPIGSMLEDVFKQLDEAKKRG